MCAMRLEDWICCPKCRASLEAHPGGGKTGPEPHELPSHAYACAACKLEYPVVDGVVDFLPSDDIKRKSAQGRMESKRIVEIYEGRWWRDSRLFRLFTRISLADEMSLVERIANLGPTDRVLDLACGPGLYTRRFAAEHSGRELVGLDLSWPMLRHASKKATKLGIENTRFMHGDARVLPLQDSSVDAANCCGALHLFPDIRRVLGELHRVIRPKGRFSMATFLRRPGLPILLEPFFGVGLHPFRREELEGLLDEAGFDPTVHHARGVWMIAGGVRRP